MAHVGTRYKCILCDDFDVCFTCFNKVKHPHTMQIRDVPPYDNLFFRSSILGNYQKHANAPKSIKFIKSIIEVLEHATQCRGCNFRDCIYIKKLLLHGKICKFKNDGKCPIYEKYFELLKCHCIMYCTKTKLHCPSVHC